MKKTAIVKLTRDVNMINRIIKIKKAVNIIGKAAAAAVVLFVGADVVKLVKSIK